MEFAAAAAIRAAAVLCEVGGVAVMQRISWRFVTGPCRVASVSISGIALCRQYANEQICHKSSVDPRYVLNKSIWELLSVLVLNRLTCFTILLVFDSERDLQGLTGIYDILIQVGCVITIFAV
jgi:hypothetical protein